MNTEDPHTETLIPLQKHLFDIPSEITYLNCCYMSPQLLSVSEAGAGFTDTEQLRAHVTAVEIGYLGRNVKKMFLERNQCFRVRVFRVHRSVLG